MVLAQLGPWHSEMTLNEFLHHLPHLPEQFGHMSKAIERPFQAWLGLLDKCIATMVLFYVADSTTLY